MRHGLINWNEKNLSLNSIEARQARLREALNSSALNGILIYTNHVRSAAVTWATGFTPYWSDALWLMPMDGPPLFATALSKRVGNWIAATNPTSEIVHSPKPGALIGARLSVIGLKKIGVVELDRMPSGLIQEVMNTCSTELVDATDVFATVRAVPELAESGLVSKAIKIADDALATIPLLRMHSGDIMQAVELSARLAGVEEVYIAIAPDLNLDTRFARVKGITPLGPRFAIRITVAFHGVWVRRIATLSRDQEDADLSIVANWFDLFCLEAKVEPGIAHKLSETLIPAGMRLENWFIEAPSSSRPLQIVTEENRDVSKKYGMANLSICLSSKAGAVLLGGPIFERYN